jgi:hypothetical protein
VKYETAEVKEQRKQGIKEKNHTKKERSKE